MHPLNKVLYQFGVMLQRTRDTTFIPRAFHESYRRRLGELRRRPGRFDIFQEERFDAGTHPDSFIDHECAFASSHLARLRPDRILDVGSYRHFILGLLAHSRVTTIDVRSRQPVSDNEDVITCDAKQLTLPSGSFDAVVSLCTLEHFGLGRYGDPFDIDADHAALAEMVRVLRPGGRLIFSTTITAGRPQIVFNAHRIYDHAMIREMCEPLVAEDERFFSNRRLELCSLAEVSAEPEVWDVYLGCWRKPA